ncbi:DHH family phosphoesterase [Halomarina litorea]|uniref:DHH family phosphoesterase n=1 Tax=Halomarina litorea TaxID=2961595 RepID=UPI0020C2BF8F|nr:OB-fold nucleic acid binding domain-containing protein [Halomarina sp. BCD28]
MGSCIICGTSTDGRICQSHEEDVVFEFRGTSPDQLTNGRFYRGSVDGYADFGVFIDIGDHVTGLLHRSELDRRLESLTWEPGDTVFVQVKNVRDNGNVDLGWSIRQAEREFRGALVDDPNADEPTFLPEEEEGAASESEAEPPTPEVRTPDPDSEDESEAESEAEPEPEGGDEAAAAEGQSDTRLDRSGPDTDSDEGIESDAGATEDGAASPGSGSVETDAGGRSERGSEEGAVVQQERPETEEAADIERVSVDSLRDHLQEVVRLEGRIVTARQTSGPTVFELRDETGVVDCAAFVEAGVRAYPDVDRGDLVRLDGEVRERRGELQVETEALVVLDDDEAATVTGRMDDALDERARPAELEPLADDPAVEDSLDGIREAATAIRRAVIESRPVIVRHDASVDGYLAGAAIERAVLPLVAEEHTDSDAAYHYFDRRPLEDGVYDMDDATKDTTSMLSNRERHDEKLPLVVFAAAGTTRDSLDGFGLLSVYGADRVVIDGGAADEEIAEDGDAVVNPALAGSESDTSATALAANVAAHVNDGVADDLRHLPAVSFWEDAPDAYVDLAGEAGYDADRVERLREAIALEAYYQSYEDKRELVIDLLFEDTAGLAEQISEQFREKLATEVETAEANLETRSEGGVAFAVLDTDAFTHRFDFPPTGLLLDEIHRRNRDGAFVTLGVGTDELHVRSTFDLDVRRVADRAAEAVEDAGVAARGGRNRIEFVAGERDAVVDAVVDAIADLA